MKFPQGLLFAFSFMLFSVSLIAQAPLPHPRFTITHGELNLLFLGESQESSHAAAIAPTRFLDLVEAILGEPRELLWLTDKTNSLPAGYEPNDLVPLDDYPALTKARPGLLLREVMIADLSAMSEAMRREKITLVLSSAYRSYDYQKGLFERYSMRDGVKAAERYSARPGTSQHQLGIAVDFGSITRSFEDTAAGQWLFEYAYKYGFSLSYPEDKESLTGYMYEPWHYRYIGKAAALMEREYFSGIQQNFLLFWKRTEKVLREKHIEGTP